MPPISPERGSFSATNRNWTARKKKWEIELNWMKINRKMTGCSNSRGHSNELKKVEIAQWKYIYKWMRLIVYRWFDRSVLHSRRETTSVERSSVRKFYNGKFWDHKIIDNTVQQTGANSGANLPATFPHPWCVKAQNWYKEMKFQIPQHSLHRKEILK